MKIGSAVLPGRVPEKKGQDSQKSHKVVIFRPYLGEISATVPIRTKICMVGSLSDIITCAKFQLQIFSAYDFKGSRISHFPITLAKMAIS